MWNFRWWFADENDQIIQEYQDEIAKETRGTFMVCGHLNSTEKYPEYVLLVSRGRGYAQRIEIRRDTVGRYCVRDMSCLALRRHYFCNLFVLIRTMKDLSTEHGIQVKRSVA